jgi:hypothetical protein
MPEVIHPKIGYDERLAGVFFKKMTKRRINITERFTSPSTNPFFSMDHRPSG